MRLVSNLRALTFAVAASLAASAANAALVVDEQFEGTYFNAAQSGRGVNFDWFQTSASGGIMGIVFYTYDADGKPSWVLANVPFSDRDVKKSGVDVFRFTGGSFGNTFTPPPGAKRDAEIAHVKRWVDHYAVLGAPHIRVFAGDAPRGASRAEAMDLLHEHKIEKLLVVDEHYRLVGLITVKDIEKAQRHPLASKDEQGRLRVGAACGTGSAGLERAEALIATRHEINPGGTFSRLHLTAPQGRVLFWLSVVVLPAFVLLFGALVGWRRRARSAA